VPHGAYIYGDVGRGKTLLLDLFFDAAPIARKRRTHFHEFMTDVHARIFAQRQEMKRGAARSADAVPFVADAIADESHLLCFDEFHVTDIADAMILSRLFERLFERGVILVATSNVAPDDLYADGLNRSLFLPFIALLKQRVDIIRLDARTDFRLEKLGAHAVWHAPADAEARKALDHTFAELTRGAAAAPLTLHVQGREVTIPRFALGIARADFADLCKHPLGAADYLALAHAVHTLVLDGVPGFSPSNRDQARRFVHLIDALYDSRVKLVASAATPPTELWQADANGSTGYEELALHRTISRLIEMGSQPYLAEPHGARGEKHGADMGGLVET
jgi:cell division protein ZapE